MHNIYTDLLEAIMEMRVLDTHEHLESEEARIQRPLDLFNTFMIHYASCDLISAGMGSMDMESLKGNSLDLLSKWKIFSPYWEKARNTVYCQSLLNAAKDIYGIEDINDDTYIELDARMKEQNRKGLYRHILKDMCSIESSILDGDPNCDAEFFKVAARFDNYIALRSKDTVIQAEKRFNISIHNLTDWVAFLKGQVKAAIETYGIVCIKSGLAYNRILRYDRTDYAAADKIFTDLFVDWHSYRPLGKEVKILEDYLMHILIQTAAEVDLPVQIHTGLQEGNGNFIAHSNPVHLSNLFMEYPKTRFDIFHAGYPYGGELCAMAKNFRNVYVDLCWSHIISREYTVHFIEEMLDAVPANKLFGFGGDYCFVEGVYGHLQIARENIARALAGKVEKGYLSKSEALKIAQWMLYDNVKDFFRM